MNVEKNSVRIPTWLNTGEPTQVSSLIPVVYAEETSAGGQAFLDIRNSTSEKKVVFILNKFKWSLTLKFMKKYRVIKHKDFSSVKNLET